MRLPRFPEPGDVLPGTAVQDGEGPRGRPHRLDGVTDGEVLEGGRFEQLPEWWTEIVPGRGKCFDERQTPKLFI